MKNMIIVLLSTCLAMVVITWFIDNHRHGWAKSGDYRIVKKLDDTYSVQSFRKYPSYVDIAERRTLSQARDTLEYLQRDYEEEVQ